MQWLRSLLEEENKTRLSDGQQALYAEAEASADPEHSWMEETDAMQRRLLRSRGIRPLEEAQALRAMRAAPYTFPELAAIPLYHRFQRARPGSLAVGDAAPDVALLTLGGGATSLVEALRLVGPVPVLLCAGSVS